MGKKSFEDIEVFSIFITCYIEIATMLWKYQQGSRTLQMGAFYMLV